MTVNDRFVYDHCETRIVSNPFGARRELVVAKLHDSNNYESYLSFPIEQACVYVGSDLKLDRFQGFVTIDGRDYCTISSGKYTHSDSIDIPFDHCIVEEYSYSKDVYVKMEEYIKHDFYDSETFKTLFANSNDNI